MVFVTVSGLNELLELSLAENCCSYICLIFKFVVVLQDAMLFKFRLGRCLLRLELFEII